VPNVEIQAAIVQWFSAWALLNVTLAVVALYFSGSEWSRGFWLVTGLWGSVNGAFAWGLYSAGPLSQDALASLLLSACCLNAGDLLGGYFLAGRALPTLRGFGVGMLVKAGFLLVFDGYFYWRCWG
jgi:hypothetical protein